MKNCILLCIGVWHLKSCFPIAVIGWEMCKNRSIGFPVVYFFQAVHAVCLLKLFGGLDIVEQKELFSQEELPWVSYMYSHPMRRVPECIGYQ